MSYTKSDYAIEKEIVDAYNDQDEEEIEDHQYERERSLSVYNLLNDLRRYVNENGLDLLEKLTEDELLFFIRENS